MPELSNRRCFVCFHCGRRGDQRGGWTKECKANSKVVWTDSIVLDSSGAVSRAIAVDQERVFTPDGVADDAEVTTEVAPPDPDPYQVAEDNVARAAETGEVETVEDDELRALDQLSTRDSRNGG